MCIKLGHKHNIFYLHYFRFQNHSTQRQSFSSYCQRPQPSGQKLKAYFYISMLLYISLKPSQYCTTQINLMSVYQHCSSELSLSSLTFLAAAQTLIYREYACSSSRLQHCSTAAGWTLVLHLHSVFYVFDFTSWLHFLSLLLLLSRFANILVSFCSYLYISIYLFINCVF